MPRCGSQCYLCDLPISFDTYRGCTHGCVYCFANDKRTGSKGVFEDVQIGETAVALLRHIQSNRINDTRWADWDIPLHWGGMSDPFQQYLELLAQCNVVLQISLVCPSYDAFEPGCPTYSQRLDIIRKTAPKVQRLIVRMQPYIPLYVAECLQALADFKEAGAYGVVAEGIKYSSKKPHTVQLGADFVYPMPLLKLHFERLREKAHSLGLAFYVGENRLRTLGDSLTCCGVEGVAGFKPNTFNLNHILNGDSEVQPTSAMLLENTGYPFKALYQDTSNGNYWSGLSFKDAMLLYYKHNKHNVLRIFGKR